MHPPRPDDGIAVITPPAELDLTCARQLHDEIKAALDRGVTSLIIDMSTTTFCDSAGTAALVHGQNRAKAMKADLRLVVPSESFVRRVFEINGMNVIMRIYSSLEAAQSGSDQLA
jgi:anti-sigma B factor antagonist